MTECLQMSSDLIILQKYFFVLYISFFFLHLVMSNVIAVDTNRQMLVIKDTTVVSPHFFQKFFSASCSFDFMHVFFSGGGEALVGWCLGCPVPHSQMLIGCGVQCGTSC